MHTRFKKEELLNYIYNRTLSLEQLLGVKKEMLTVKLDRETTDYVDDLLEDEFDVMNYEDLLKVKKDMIELGIDTYLIDIYILRKGPLTNKNLDKMDKDDFLYIIDTTELDLDTLLNIKSRILDMDITNYELDSIDQYIYNILDDIYSREELDKALKLFKKYDLPIPNNKINHIEERFSEDEEEDDYLGTITSAIIGAYLGSKVSDFLFGKKKK